jgi:transposase-like protein
MFAAEIRGKRVEAMRVHRHWQWRLDEVYVKTNGMAHYLWRAVDQEGEMLESIVTKARDRKAALKFSKKSMKRHGRPEAIVTDRLRSYGAALKDVGRGDDREMGRWLNNRAENRTCHSDDASGRCCGSGACEHYRSSPRSIPRSTTTFRRSATSKIATPARRPAPPLLPSGAAFSHPDLHVGVGVTETGSHSSDSTATHPLISQLFPFWRRFLPCFRGLAWLAGCRDATNRCSSRLFRQRSPLATRPARFACAARTGNWQGKLESSGTLWDISS